MSSILHSKKFHAFLGFFVSIALIVWIVQRVEWNKVGEALLQINYWWFVPITLVFLFHYYLRSLRWRYLLPEGDWVPTRIFFDAITVGAFASYILPLRAGEFVRPYLLSLQSKYTFSVGFVSVVVERFFDLSMVLFSFAVMVLYVEKDIPDGAYQGAWGLGVLALLILAFMLIGSFFPKSVLRCIEFCTQPLPDTVKEFSVRFAGELLAGAAVLTQGGRLLKVVILSVVIWGTCYLLFYVFLLLFGLPPLVWLAVSVAVIIALAVAAPSAPGFIGVYQVATIASFKLFGLSAETALAYAIVSHLYQYLFFISYGLYVLSRYQMKLGQLRRASMPRRDGK